MASFYSTFTRRMRQNENCVKKKKEGKSCLKQWSISQYIA